MNKMDGYGQKQNIVCESYIQCMYNVICIWMERVTILYIWIATLCVCVHILESWTRIAQICVQKRETHTKRERGGGMEMEEEDCIITTDQMNTKRK